MKNPNTVNLQTSAEIRKAGWQAECRDADGHLCRTHVPFETDEEIVWLVREAMEHGETITIWPSSEVAETPPSSSHLTDMASSNKGPSRGGDEPLGQYRKQRPDVQQAGGPNVPPDQQSWVIFENLLVAAEKVLAGLNARIDAADKRAVPVFHGIVDLHDAIHEARAALATATEGSGE